MSTDRSLALAGIAVSTIGIGIAVLFPSVAAVGWASLIGGVLMVLVIPAHLVLQRLRPNVPTRSEWLDQEHRFGLIEDELEGMRETHDTGRVRWSAWPKSEQRAARAGVALRPKHPDRSRQRFEVEAEHAGQMLKRANYVVPGFPSAAETDGFDYWMSGIAVNVSKESDMTGNGRDEIGKSTSEHIGNIVHASKLLCAFMARRAGS